MKSSLACKTKLIGKKTENGTIEYKTKGAEHTHILDPRDVEIKNRMKAAKQSAEATKKTTREVYADALTGVPKEVIGQMPSTSTFSKTVRRQRKHNYPTAPTSLKELVLPEIITSDGENFVFYDNGPDAPDRLIVFGTQTAIDFMATCPILFMDGTFSTSPPLFEQLYVIHGSRDGWRAPLLYALCAKKTTQIYVKLLEQIKLKLPDYSPEQVNMDFELAAINAVKQVFPNAKLQCCLFHLKQSIGRNLASNQLKPRLETDLKFATEIRQMIAVAFLPPDQVSYDSKIFCFT